MWPLAGLTGRYAHRTQGLSHADESKQATRAVVLVPTKELAEQVTAHLRGLTKYCEDDVMLANVASGTTAHLQR